MIRHRLQLMALTLVLSLPAKAQQVGFRDKVLDRFTGRWTLTGTIAGSDVVHSIDARWVLGHQYLQFDESTEVGKIDYEATVLCEKLLALDHLV